jgi:molybdopterin molybdotransferase
MLTLAEAQAALLDGVAPLPAEDCTLARCAGRTLAEHVFAERSQPPDPVSAMDGYAVREADAAAGAELRVIGESPAGAPFAGEVVPGTAVRIATGGVVPAGAERIIIQELVDRESDHIRIREQPGEAAFVRAAGSDFAAGQAVLSAGDRLTPARIALAAAANRDALRVHASPRVLILASGDELREPGGALGKGEIVNSAGYAIEALVKSWGGAAERMPLLADDRDECRKQLVGSALDAEVIVPLGGASVGDRDVLRPLFAEMGAEIRFDRVAVQPGKPTWHARFADGRLVLGLPGNPASAFVCAWLFLKPLLHALLGRCGPALHFLPAQAETDFPANGPRESFLRGTADFDPAGRLAAHAGRQQDSHLQLPLAYANALIRRPANAPAVARGEPLELLLIEPL